MIIASCLLSDIDSDADLGRPTLPSFDFFLRSIAEAMEEDELWGPGSFEDMEAKAVSLQNGMQDLMRQTQSIELIMTPAADSPLPPSPSDEKCASYFDPVRRGSGIPTQRSTFAEKQARMLREEQQWLKHNVRNCWESVNQDTFAAPVTTEFVRRMSTIGIEG